MSTWIIASSSASISAIVEAAGPEANLLIVGDETLASQLSNTPVARIVHVPLLQLPELYAPTVGQWLKEQGADTILAADFASERALATAATVALNGAWISSASAWSASERSASVSVAGMALETVKAQGPVGLVLPSSDIPCGSSTDVETVSLQASEGVEVVETQPAVSSSSDLSRSERVIGVGRGIAQEKDLEMINKLAKTIDAKVGATRPLAEGHGWFDSYIGLTGQPVTAELYMAIGVSGQIHHTGGVRESRIIVAINEDPQAPIFQEADYGIIGDLYEVVPAIQAAL
ncbi:electron transfer flavoprotein subunit alpha/FixB family protein [Arcanobacterium ihumii]|uniref:electron transfer flavoprotein subunit alpha/FixB family protein n=1 Tax=Arcanobacterium ihumii TaxID=2138162 RepID=UPI000F539C04|nr:FAD-binding protein [Arcanobacterium ihumii]